MLAQSVYNQPMSFLLRALIVIGVIYWFSPVGERPDLANLAPAATDRLADQALAYCRDKPADCLALIQQGQEALRPLKN
jgi:hypothetical protein